MKIKSITVSALLAASLILMTSCATSGSYKGSNPDAYDIIEVYDPSLTLADYIRRAGGVNIQSVDGRTSIRIRGNLSFNSNSDPLFVVDGVRSGNDYDRVENFVPLDYIKSVQVLKGIDASSLYGLAASSGAIVITTKR